MENDDIALIRDFHYRYRTISNSSGYGLVYELLALIREMIPCREIGIKIGKAASESLKNLYPKSETLWVATRQMGKTQDQFRRLLPHIPYVQRAASKVFSNVFAGKPVEAVSFSDDVYYGKGLIDYFYTKIVRVSDVAATAGLIARHQLFRSELTRGYYISVISVARDNGQFFNSREKHLIALFFEIFLEDFRQKIRCPDNSSFLPYLSNPNFKAREIATIKACFDLKMGDLEISRSSVAQYLHLQGRDNCNAAELKKAVDKVDYDVRKIKASILKQFEQDSSENYKKLQKQFGLEHFTDIFKSYAYFGLYPDIPKGRDGFISDLSTKLGQCF